MSMNNFRFLCVCVAKCRNGFWRGRGYLRNPPAAVGCPGFGIAARLNTETLWPGGHMTCNRRNEIGIFGKSAAVKGRRGEGQIGYRNPDGSACLSAGTSPGLDYAMSCGMSLGDVSALS